MAYSSASDVAAYTPNLLDSGHDNFTSTTRPTKSQVERYLSAACGMIETRLNAAGYTTPVTAGTVAYDLVSDLESLYAAGRAEMVRMTARVAATERTRSQMFMDQFNNGLDTLLQMDLSRAGISHQSRLYAGGISVSDKSAVDADTDRVPTRFSKGQFRHAGTQRPSSSADDEESD